MGAGVDVRPVRGRRRPPGYRALLRAVPWGSVAVSTLSALVVLTLLAGVVFAGSPSRIAAGVRIAGVNVAGMTGAEATRALEVRAARYAPVPVVFVVGERRFPLRPSELDARVDWAALAAEARAAGSWPMPFRGLKRLAVRLAGTDVAPRARVSRRALDARVAAIAVTVDRPAREAAVVLRGLSPAVVPERAGRRLDRARARRAIVAALAGFERRPVALPTRVDRPRVTAEELAPAVAQVRTALSAPVRFGWKDAHWLVRPRQLARLLELPAGGATELRIGGPEATRYLARIDRALTRRPKDATFAIAGAARVRVVPATAGRSLDMKATAEALLAAALSTQARDAEFVVRTVAPDLTTREARAMGVTRVLASYSTWYSGTADRIRNLQIAVSLLDGTRIAPGGTFSFNETVGPRTEERGFRPAPVIMEGKYEEGVGGGVSQVATTVFNAAWEAGLKITSRTPHALYISRYPLGRDATVNYPDIDLTFKNDTPRWLVMLARSGETGISVTLLGSPTGRRVVSEAGPLVETKPPEVERVRDPSLFVGEKVVEDDGEPARAVTVTRTVYEGDRVLYDETWHTSYLSEPKIVRVGTKPRPVEEPAPKPAEPKEEPKGDGKNDGGKPTDTEPTATTPTTTTGG